MIRLTRETDYAIVLLVHLAAAQGTSLQAGTHNARALAEACRLRPPMVGKILKTLSRTGILASHRGSRGGYTLARPASQITVAEVVSAMEGPVAMTECAGGGTGSCEHESFCGVRSNWQIINRALRSALENLTLAEMARPLQAPGLVKLSIARPLPRRNPAAMETS